MAQKPRRWTPAEATRLAALWRAGLSIDAIAGAMDRSRNSIIGRVQRDLLPCRPRSLNPQRSQDMQKSFLELKIEPADTPDDVTKKVVRLWTRMAAQIAQAQPGCDHCWLQNLSLAAAIERLFWPDGTPLVPVRRNAAGQVVAWQPHPDIYDPTRRLSREQRLERELEDMRKALDEICKHSLNACPKGRDTCDGTVRLGYIQQTLRRLKASETHKKERVGENL